MHNNPVRGGKTLVNTGFAAHCTTRKSTKSSRAIRAALAILSAALLFVCGIFGGLSWMPVVGGVLAPLTVHAASSYTIELKELNGGDTEVFLDGISQGTMQPGIDDELVLGNYGIQPGDSVDVIITGNVRVKGVDFNGANVVLKPAGNGSASLSTLQYLAGIKGGTTMTVAQGVTLDVSSERFFYLDGILVNNGNIINRSSNSNPFYIRDGSLINNGTIENAGIGELNVSSSGTFTNNGIVTNDGGISNNGTINNSGTLTNSGYFNNNNGTINNSGTITGITGGIINQISPVPAAPASSCATGHASYTWQMVSMPDVHNDGEMVFACAGCGHVLYRVPLSAYGPFQKVTAEKIRNAAQGATVEITTSRWISFHRSVMEALAARPDVTLTISFLDGGHRGNRRIVTIPAGYDTLSLLNGTDYCGFLYLGSKFGLH